MGSSDEPGLRVMPGRRRVRTLLVIAGVALLCGACFFLRGMMLRSDAVNRDFISYWSTARLMREHHNPYDRAAVWRVEQAAGARLDHPLIMRNAPWALFVVAPLGWMDPATAALLWMLAIIASALVALRLMQPQAVPRIPLTLCFFAPTIICAGAEQTAVFTLLGVVLFARLQERRPFAAGLALTLAMLKPHLLVLFWVVLLLEMWRKRQGRAAAGAASGLLAASGLALWCDPHVWGDYFAAMRAENLGAVFCPNLSTALRFLAARQAVWIEALPTLMGIAAAVWYWRSRHNRWTWARQGAMVTALSALTAPYSWPFDQVLFLPAMMEGLPGAGKRSMAVLAVLNVAALILYAEHPFLETPVYLWMAPAWMLWCLVVYRRGDRAPAEALREAAGETF